MGGGGTENVAASQNSTKTVVSHWYRIGYSFDVQAQQKTRSAGPVASGHLGHGEGG